MKSKKALILYSGGKDSHLALLYSVKKGYQPIIFNICGGKKHHIFFSQYEDLNIIKTHEKLMNLKINYFKIREFKPIDIFKEIVKKFTELSGEAEDKAYFSSNDHQEFKKDKKINMEFKKICQKYDIKFVSFLDIIKKDDFYSPIKESLKNKINSVIIGLERNFEKEMLLKKIDNVFISFVNKKIREGEKIDSNSYQSLVLDSPLFKKGKIKIIKYDYFYDPKDIRYFAKIKDFKIIKK